MLLRRSIALDNLSRTLPPIDEDPSLALLHAPFKGTNYSVWRRIDETPRGEHEACCHLQCVPYANSAPCLLLFSSVCQMREKFTDRRGSRKPGGHCRGQGRSTPSSTSTKPGQSKEGQTTLTVSVPQDSNKHKVEPQDDTSQTPRKNKQHFRGKSQGKKQ